MLRLDSDSGMLHFRAYECYLFLELEVLSLTMSPYILELGGEQGWCLPLTRTPGGFLGWLQPFAKEGNPFVEYLYVRSVKEA